MTRGEEVAVLRRQGEAGEVSRSSPAEVGGVRKLGWMNGVEEYHAEHTSFQECLIITADVM